MKDDPTCAYHRARATGYIDWQPMWTADQEQRDYFCANCREQWKTNVSHSRVIQLVDYPSNGELW